MAQHMPWYFLDRNALGMMGTQSDSSSVRGRFLLARQYSVLFGRRSMPLGRTTGGHVFVLGHVLVGQLSVGCLWLDRFGFAIGR